MKTTEYLKDILNNEEMQRLLECGGSIRKNPTEEIIKSLPQEYLQQELLLINNKQSTLSKKQRELVIKYIKR